MTSGSFEGSSSFSFHLEEKTSWNMWKQDNIDYLQKQVFLDKLWPPPVRPRPKMVEDLYEIMEAMVNWWNSEKLRDYRPWTSFPFTKLLSFSGIIRSRHNRYQRRAQNQREEDRKTRAIISDCIIRRVSSRKCDARQIKPSWQESLKKHSMNRTTARKNGWKDEPEWK